MFGWIYNFKWKTGKGKLKQILKNSEGMYFHKYIPSAINFI